MRHSWENVEVLITGGTGSLGKAITNLFAKEKYPLKGLRIFSRDELKQYQMKQSLIQLPFPFPVSFLIGDIRDRKRIELATKEVDIIIHTAALKQVPFCENNPLETIQTNVVGSQNIVYAALENKVKKVMAISTDKACEPWTLYGASKAISEKLFINANVYSGGRSPRFSCCRYGNIASSRGSVIPLFKKQAKDGTLTITDKKMTRFFMALDQVSLFIVKRIEEMKGEEIFVPHMYSCNILDLAKFIAPDAKVKQIGIRGDEKLHEVLITKNESKKTKVIKVINDKFYEISHRNKNEIEIDYISNNPKCLKPIDYFKDIISK